jgi:hypothetical protein
MKQELEFFDATSVDWEPAGGPGLTQRVLSGDKTSGDHTRILRFEPGTVTSETLVHDFWEEVYILEGAMTDLRLNETFTAGMYACRPPGMEHGPWETPEGCLTFEVRYSARPGEA